MYDGDHSLSDTAVFTAFDDASYRSVCSVSTIQKVDGKETSRVAFPIWVRVKPGSHSFVIHCSSDYSMGYQSVGFKLAELSVDVRDMKPRRVYVTRFQRTADGVGVNVVDLGEGSNYFLPTGGQFNRKDVKPEF
jgi:hypothetical protein